MVSWAIKSGWCGQTNNECYKLGQVQYCVVDGGTNGWSQMKVGSGPLLLLLGLGHSVNWCGMAMYQLVLGINGILFERIFRKVMLGNALQICTCSIT